MGPEAAGPGRGAAPRLQVRTWIEPVVAATQVASSLYEAGLLLVVKASFGAGAGAGAGAASNHSAGPPRGAPEDQQQRAISNFYIVYNLVVGLTPLLSAYALGWLSDRRHRKVAICVALLGFLLSRVGLLLKVLLDWPVEVLYGAAALNGLCGGFSAFWAGVMALGSLGSSEGRRSVRLVLIDLILGLAGFCGSMASGHLFKQVAGHSGQGLVLTACSVSCATFALLYSLLVLKVPEAAAGSGQALSAGDSVAGTVGTYRTLDPDHSDKQSVQGLHPPSPGKAKPRRTIIALLFLGAIVYDLAVVGTVDVMPLFVLREPLSWNQVQVGYGMAAGYTIFITSFLGVLVFSRCFQDTTMIMIGMVSFGSGALLLAFVKETYMFYIARAVMLFALIPITTIRSAMSKLIKGSSYGKVFVILQLSLTLTGVVTSTVYNKIYQVTMEKFIGTCFALSSFLSFLAIIPIGIVAYKQASWLQYGDVRET
ncbi:solute carrier family 46 member 2 [Canis lupus baileyi]|uniref:Solute carrier family 46 member 2 n=2 Tax=Canis lupus TaxID=9612 RepID=S46A2_CANLF|nr:solute carrier family 46 member 2 [Canis lupus familiaris]XP_025288629.1 thymic stromal cotransporter homolog [Canis lupus dingo]Q866G7.1 RecName: Full=Solute carrier family 46 member 2; AltName: Full=CE11; AltName: Full=Thymic stromal cotransporter homolog [Canis lupus familiaris]AAO23670.1 12-transmembrane domain co-transporter Ce11 [Canis lupus familiaris]|eukprot:NP_001002997.1 thymic stromal cotransporter homolog [Canis lupus familiaris]